MAQIVATRTKLKSKALYGFKHTGPVSAAFAPAPRNKQHANRRPTLVAYRIDLPPLLQLRSKSYLKRLYSDRLLSIKEIARLADVSHAAVHEAFKRFAIPRSSNGRKRPSQVPFVYDYIDCRPVKNRSEQEVIRTIR